jgi:hypothetical protein
MRRPPRIFIGFEEVAGYCAGLKKGFDENGVASVCFLIRDHRFQYADPENLPLLTLIRSVLQMREACKARAKNTPNPLAKVLFMAARLGLALAQNVVWLAVFFCALAKFDVFIFQGRASFSHLFRFPVRPGFLDLAILKLLRKKVIYVFHGTDTRPAYVNGSAGIRRLSTREMLRYVKKQARDLKAIEKYADFIVHYPLNTQLHKRRIVSHDCLGRPVTGSAASDETRPRLEEGAVRIVHAPSDPVGKGSAKIKQSIQNLIQKGHRIEYVELADKSNREVKGILAGCDFVVDQLYYDVSISILGTEAAFLGKAVLFGSYAKEEFKKVIPPAFLPPTVICLPEEMEEAIERLISDKESRASLGAKSRAFVEQFYGPKKVAGNFLRLINGNVPEEWLFDPNSLEYCHGYGFSRTEVKGRIRELIQQGGEASLCLDDKPMLKERFIKFAAGA